VKKENLFFIYGTLKKNGNNFSILKKYNAKFIGEVITKNKYPMFKLQEYFPYLQNNKNQGNIIKGELFEIDKKYHDSLDYFEGVPKLYINGKITVIYNNEEIEVNCYFKSKNIDLKNVKLFDEWEV